ncbi:MAG: Fe-S cluster assembly sulfur transfer protein SufU, partial [Candidatus Binatia bacterium]
MGDIYDGELMAHVKAPHNWGRLADPEATGTAANPLCGDEVNIYLKLGGQKIADARFDGELCAVGKASASLMTDAIRGHTKEEIAELRTRVASMLEDGEDPPLGSLEALRAVRQYRVRIRCALLPWDALGRACSGS